MTTVAKSAGLLAALASLAAVVPAAAREPETLLVRALSCQLGEGEIATLMAAAAIAHPGMKAPVQSLAAPSGNLYRLAAPVSALGYSTADIYVSPGRILMAVSGQTRAAISAKLRLTPETYGPDERRLEGGRALVAYQLHQSPLADKVLVGCAYDDPAALAWLGQEAAGF